MSSISTPNHEVTGLMGRRNLTNIPRDQLSLLESSDSWPGDRNQQPDARAHVPAHVLDSVKAAYIAQRDASKKPSTSTKSSQPENSASSSALPNGNAARHAAQSQVPPSPSPERLMSWSPSPPRDLARDQAAVDSQIVRETPKAAPKSVLKKTPSSMPPPPHPTSVSRPLADIEYPSSGPEEDLEMELPQAQAYPDAPINRTASRLQATVASPVSSGRRPMDTPPCAQGTQVIQPVIPNTVAQVSIGQREEGPENRLKRHWQEINFSQDALKDVPPPTKIRLAPTKDCNQEVISSNSTTSSSVISATSPVQGPVTSSIEDNRGNHEENPHSEDNTLQTVLSQSQKRTPASPPYLPTKFYSPPDIMNSNEPPFEVFCRAYPTYTENHTGSLYEFIKACSALDFIRLRRALRDCMYDEFIREFPKFRYYVNNPVEDEETLPAVEWFNTSPGPPRFSRMVVTRENLGFVLDTYPKEVILAKQRLDPNTLFRGSVFQFKEESVPGPMSAPPTIPSSARTPASTAQSSASARKARSATTLENLTKPLSTPSRAQSRPIASLPSTSLTRHSASSVVSQALTERPLGSKALLHASSSGRQASSIAPFSSYANKRHTIGGSMAPPPSKRSRANSMAPTPSVAASTVSGKTPRKSQYLESLGTNRDKAASRRRSMEERAQLKEYLKQKSIARRGTSTAL